MLHSDRLARGRLRWQYFGLVSAWVAGQAWFWSWWLRGDHVVTLPGLIINSLLLLWTTFLPAWYLFFLGRARQQRPTAPLPDGRVAMVVTKAPSEPWSVVQPTLEAMLVQDFPRPYDVWLADEDPVAATRAWCAAHGVRVSSRKGVADYNNPTWPRRAKCKEGNLAFFYEVTGGYERYDFVSQLDADHIPEPTYLAEVIRPFDDPAIGYVAAPSMCDSNAAQSWAARGRLYAEAAWHGSVQAGFNRGFAPQCIGSHYAVRTRALREIGGIGPELAEDFSTTLLMNAGGWQGAFALNASAHGEGPATVADLVVQEFQWARSVVSIFLSLWRSKRSVLSRRVRVQLGFAQVWYFLFALHLVGAYLLPVGALMSGTAWVDIDFAEYLVRASVPTLVGIATLLWARRQGWLRPSDAPVLSWEAVLFEFVRWPWVAVGIGHAVVGWVIGRQFGFRVTPKGSDGPRLLPRRVLAPYVVLVLIEAGVALLVEHPGNASGYVYLALASALSYTVVIAALIVLHARENPGALFRPLVRLTPSAALACSVTIAALVVRGEPALAAIAPQPAPIIAVAPPAALPEPPAALPAPPALDLPPERIAIGAYDPQGWLAAVPMDVEQTFVNQDDPEALNAFLLPVANSRTAMVTIEPWPSSADAPLDEVIAGTADANLANLARVIAAQQPRVVLVRWGHEMDLDHVYPWGAQDTDRFVAAYRHVVQVFRTEGATNARFVWSPAGNANAVGYYPGDDVVDYVGLTVLADEQWDASFGQPPQSFEDIFAPRYRLLAGLGKPFIVSELGVSGPSARQVAWLEEVPSVLARYPGVRAVLYFDAPNPPVQVLPTQPDWRVDPALLARLGATVSSQLNGGGSALAPDRVGADERDHV